MPSLSEQVRETVSDYLELLEGTFSPSPAHDLGELESALERLDRLGRDVPSYDFEDGHEATGPGNPEYYRELVSNRFPLLELSAEATDDLAEIASHIYEVGTCFAVTSDRHALAQFRFGYEHVWGERLRKLRRDLATLG